MEKFLGFPEVILAFPRETHNHIHADAGIRHDLPDTLNPIAVQVGKVTPSHLHQDGIAAALQGNMKMRDKAGTPSDKINGFVLQQIGFDGRNTYPFDPLYRIQGPYQIEKGVLVPLVTKFAFPVIPYVNSGQDDFLDALGRYLPGILYDILQRIAS